MMSTNRLLTLVGCLLLVAAAVVLPTQAEHAADAAPATTPAHSPVALPGAALWREAALEGAPLRLDLQAGSASVSLEPVKLWHDSLEVRGVDGTPLAEPDILPLDGRVAGDVSALLRATVSGERVTGILHSAVYGDHEIATGSDGVVRAFPDALVRTLPGVGGAIDDAHDPAPSASFAASASDAARLADPASASGDGGPDCLSAVPELAGPAGLLDGWTTRTLDIAFPVDIHYTVSHEDWVGDVVAAANTLDGLYQHDFDLAIEIVHIIVIPPAAIPGPGSQDYLTQTAAYYSDTYPTLARDAVYLGVANPDHGFGGQAECIGGAGFPEYAYGVGTTDSDAPYSFTGYDTLLPGKQYKIAAHEIGHLLTAHHHHANCVESVPGYDPFITLDVCTVMINDWGLIQPVFSSLNRLVVRDHADQHDL